MTGYCVDCGYSLFHYNGKICVISGIQHPIWTEKPPPSYVEINDGPDFVPSKSDQSKKDHQTNEEQIQSVNKKSEN